MKCLRIGLLVLAASSSAWATAAPVVVSGMLSGTDPTYHRPSAGTPPNALSAASGHVSYDVYAFNVSLTGTYELQTTDATFDSFIALYRDSFDPSMGLENAVAANDDCNGGTHLSCITQALTQGTEYYFVATSYYDGVTGSYTAQFDSVGSVGQVVLGPLAMVPAAPGTIPEPSTLVLAGVGLVGLTVSRRRAAALLHLRSSSTARPASEPQLSA